MRVREDPIRGKHEKSGAKIWRNVGKEKTLSRSVSETSEEKILCAQKRVLQNFALKVGKIPKFCSMEKNKRERKRK